MKIKITTLFLLLVFSTRLWGGNEHGSGGDVTPLENESAWFLGSGKTIKICYEVIRNFGAPAPTLEKLIKDSFQGWANYFSEKVKGRFPAASLEPTFETEITSGCTGSEDLKFYFGQSNPQVETAKAKYFNPIAFAERTQYRVESGWGKGFVWIAPPSQASNIDWTIPYALTGVMLHELGHVFGCEHVEGTIMTPSIANILYRGKILSHIDQENELVLPDWETFSGSGWMGKYQSSTEYYQVFKLLTQKDAAGIPRATLKLNGYSGELNLADSEKESSFSIQFSPDAKKFQSPAQVFKAVAYVESAHGPVKSVVSIPGGQARVWFGTMPVRGTVYPVVLFRNEGFIRAELTLGNGSGLFYSVEGP